MRFQLISAVLLVSTGTASAAGGAPPSSLHMLDSLMGRDQGVTSSGAVTSTLESGILAIALADAAAQYPSNNGKYTDYLAQVLAAVAPDLGNATRNAAKPQDRFSIYTGINDAHAVHARFSDPAPVDAAYDAINASFALQTRNPDGGLWYYVYPEWSYLDGVFSLLPFMAAGAQPNYTDIALQLRLLSSHCFDNSSGLYLHGYDWSRKAVWANAETGASPYVWGRSLGWFLAGLVQTWEVMDCRSSQKNGPAERNGVCTEMQRIMSSAAPRLVSFADSETGVWWQLTTLGSRSGNFLESSSTGLFIFSLLKAQRLGLLAAAAAPKCCGDGCGGDGLTIQKAALRAYDYTMANFVTDSGNGTIGFDKTVAVNSLNSTATFEYYTSRPLVPNGLLGEASFVLASLEVEKLAA